MWVELRHRRRHPQAEAEAPDEDDDEYPVEDEGSVDEAFNEATGKA